MPSTAGEIVVLIPAYMAEKAVASVVSDCRLYVEEVIVVDDGSSDNTADRAAAAGAHVIRCSPNAGKGKAIRAGLDYLKNRNHAWVVLMDADGQHDPHDLKVFIEAAASSKALLINGNRLGHAHNMPLIRRWTNCFMSFLVSKIAGIKVSDTQCGYKMLAKAFVAAADLIADRYEIEDDLILEAARLGGPIEHVSVKSVYADEVSHIRPFHDALRFINFLLTYRRYHKG